MAGRRALLFIRKCTETTYDGLPRPSVCSRNILFQRPWKAIVQYRCQQQRRAAL